VSRRRDIRLPPDRNPRTLQLARTLRAANPDDSATYRRFSSCSRSILLLHFDAAQAVDDSVDEFLFDTSAAFAAIMHPPSQR